MALPLRTELVSELHSQKVRQMERASAWYQSNKDKLREKRRLTLRAWRIANRDKYLAQKKNWRERNKAKIAVWMKRWRQKNPEKVKAQRENWCNQNKDLLRSYSRKNYCKNPQRVINNAKLFQKRQTETVGSYYARKQLSKKTSIPMSAWPEELVKLKQVELKLKRQIKTYGKTNKHQ